MVMTNKAKEFYEAIESLVWKHDIEYMDAIIMHCEKNNIEVESVASLIKSNENIKSKIQIEAEKLHFLPKTARLDI
jgi:Phage late-transcription coactivator